MPPPASLNVCFIASEIAPLSKTGGLADVAGALAKYLHADGHDIRVFAPLYRQIERRNARDSGRWNSCSDIPAAAGRPRLSFSVQTARLPGSQAMVYLIDAPALFERERIYGNAPDEHLRFILLTHAALLCCQRMGFAPQILHCNDWHTGFGPLLLKTTYAWDRLFQGTRSLMSIHNIAYQGTFAASAVADIGLGDAAHMLDGGERYAGRVNPLREGIAHADAISTVSPTYALEIQTPEYGYGLDGLLRARAASAQRHPEWCRLRGVGSAHGPLPAAPLRRRQPRQQAGAEAQPDAAAGPGHARRASAAPLLGMVSRLASQKGFDLVMTALPPLLARPAFLRAPCWAAATSATRNSSARWPRLHPTRVHFRSGYSEEHAHWIEAASDMFLMPSQYEPCGLNQMYSLRYGTIPVVRRTGGLNDSVRHFDPATGQGTGVVFNDYDAAAVTWGLRDRAGLVCGQTAVAEARGQRDGGGFLLAAPRRRLRGAVPAHARLRDATSAGSARPSGRRGCCAPARGQPHLAEDAIRGPHLAVAQQAQQCAGSVGGDVHVEVRPPLAGTRNSLTESPCAKALPASSTS